MKRRRDDETQRSAVDSAIRTLEEAREVLGDVVAVAHTLSRFEDATITGKADVEFWEACVNKARATLARAHTSTSVTTGALDTALKRVSMCISPQPTSAFFHLSRANAGSASLVWRASRTRVLHLAATFPDPRTRIPMLSVAVDVRVKHPSTSTTFPPTPFPGFDGAGVTKTSDVVIQDALGCGDPDEYLKSLAFRPAGGDGTTIPLVMTEPQWCLLDIRVPPTIQSESGKALRFWIDNLGTAALHSMTVASVRVNQVSFEWDRGAEICFGVVVCDTEK